MSFNHIAFDASEDGIALVTIQRPQKLNAINLETLQELEIAFRNIGNDKAIRALIVTGAGEKAFVAGADIGELAKCTPVEAQQLSRRGQSTFRILENLGKPSIAAVNGFALGGGLELALSCSMRVASPNARMGLPEVKLGILAGYGGTQRLPRLIGRGRALEMLLTGEPVDAEEALRLGLVNRIFPQNEIVAGARAILKKILVNAPLAVQLTMQAVDAGLNSTLDEGLQFEAASFAVAFSTDDRREGTQAFLEKRAAVFTGH
jgi:enoyl-CoA hydratase